MVARKIMRLWRDKYKGPWWFPYGAGLLLLILFIGTVYYFFVQTRMSTQRENTVADTAARVNGGLLTQSCAELDNADF